MHLYMLFWEKLTPVLVIGPGFGAILATAFYKLLLALDYQGANPGQDSDSRMGDIGAVHTQETVSVVSKA